MNLQGSVRLDPQRLFVGAALLVLASAAGLAERAQQVDRDTQNFFYISNPEGPGGNYSAWQATRWACDPDDILTVACTSPEAISRTFEDNLDGALLQVHGARD